MIFVFPKTTDNYFVSSTTLAKIDSVNSALPQRIIRIEGIDSGLQHMSAILGQVMHWQLRDR
jgi:Cu/Ag efflux pump CusA